LIGSTWFSPKFFYPAWNKALEQIDKNDPNDQNMGPVIRIFAFTILASLMQAIFMALMVNAMGSMSGGATLASGASTGFLLWLGFVAPSSLDQQVVRRPREGLVLRSRKSPAHFCGHGRNFGRMAISFNAK
jgi:hypothetical protein